MRISLGLRHPISRGTTILAATAICGWLVYVVACDFLVRALTDERIQVTADATPGSFITAPFTEERIGVNPDVLARAVRYFPNSARLYMRLAEFESRGDEDLLPAAENHALRASELSPHDYRPHLLLASIRESQGNLEGSQESVGLALRLAPGNLEAHWDLAVLLQGNGKLQESFEHFRKAASGHPAYYMAGLDFVWAVSGEDPEAVKAITPDTPKDKLALAEFLLNHSHASTSAAVFRQINRETLLADPDSSRYLDRLIASGNVTLAHDLWSELVQSDPIVPKERGELFWNGGFESGILVNFAQFDWSISPSKYARISIDTGTLASGGSRSLRIDFLGLDTTKLEGEIRQRILVRPGTQYRLYYAVKAAELIAPEGPRVVIKMANRAEPVAISAAVRPGSSGWQQRTLDFTAPGSAITIEIQQHPQFSYEDPAYGTVWFDDFKIREIRGK